MNRQFILSVIVLFVVTMLLGDVVHVILLKEEYSRIPNVMRPASEVQSLFPMLVLGYLLVSIGLTWIYRMGKSENDEWMAQGVRFGLAIAIVATIPSFMIAYVVEQIPESLAIKQIAYETASTILVGMVTAFMNR